jgi:hypothetical protein
MKTAGLFGLNGPAICISYSDASLTGRASVEVAQVSLEA